MTDSIAVYGIKTCDTCRKALKWLDGEGLTHRWIDIRTDPEGLPAAVLTRALQDLPLEKVVNKSSKAWRELADGQKADIAAAIDAGDPAFFIGLFSEHPTLMKRPLIVTDKACTVGFGPAQQAQLKG